MIGRIAGWPAPNVPFTDVSPVWERHPHLFADLVDRLCEHYRENPPTVLMPIEARAFLFAGAMSRVLELRVVMARKGPKLPREFVAQEFGSGYESGLVMGAHRDAITSDDRVLIVDDTLAMGWSVVGAARLVEKMGARCHGIAVAFELGHLSARSRKNIADWTDAEVFAASRTADVWVPD